MLQTRYLDNMIPELCWSPKLQKAQLASISDKEEQENNDS